MTKQQKLELMGKIVTVKKVLYRTYESVEEAPWRKWREKNINPRTGWIVGFRIVYEGKYNMPRYDLFGDLGPYLSDLRPAKCVLVAFWTNLNLVRVPLDGFERGGVPKIYSDYIKEVRDAVYIRESFERKELMVLERG